MTSRNAPVRVLRLRAELIAVVTLVAIALGLLIVVATNLETSARIRKESQEANLLTEMQVSLTAIEEVVAAWQTEPEAAEHPASSPVVIAAAEAFEARADQLLELVDDSERDSVSNFRQAFRDYVATGAELTADIAPEDVTELVRMSFAIQTPLLELLEHESAHLIGSLAADRRSEDLLRWGTPLLLILALVVFASMMRLRVRSRELDEQRRANEAQTEFIGSVSHELRTPLSAIVALSHELNDRLDDFTPAEVIEFVATIAAESDEVTAIVDDLLVAARLETGRLSMMPQALDLEDEIAHAVQAMGDMAGLEVDVAGAVVADRGRLRQIVRNLLSNAYRYGGKKVLVLSQEQDSETLVVVADSGPPIPEELREHMFEPFAAGHQGDGVTASVGLGLSVSQHLASLMGGSLTYSHEDGWSRFNLTLPTAPRVDPATKVPANMVVSIRRPAA